MSNLIFHDSNVYGTFLKGYLFINKEYLKFIKRYPYHDEAKNYNELTYNDWTFEELVARLHYIANANSNRYQQFFDENLDKSTFQLIGSYKGDPFTLYDYKGDKCVHIGGNDDLDLDGLINELNVLVKNTEPKAFEAICSYTGDTYRYSQ